MPIEFFCPGCGKLMRTPDDTGGRKGRCPSCQTKVLIPAASVLASTPQASAANEPSLNTSDTISLNCSNCGRLLQVPEFVNTSVKGFMKILDRAFLPDGMSRQIPGYTDMYLRNLLKIPDLVEGCWETTSSKNNKLEECNTHLKLIYSAVVDQLRPDGRHAAGALALGSRPGPRCRALGRRLTDDRRPAERPDDHHPHQPGTANGSELVPDPGGSIRSWGPASAAYGRLRANPRPSPQASESPCEPSCTLVGRGSVRQAPEHSEHPVQQQ